MAKSLTGYTPRPAPPVKEGEAAEVAAWAAQELALIGNVLQEFPILQFQVLYSAPSRPREGMVVVADGTTWNPGGGAGIYLRIGGAWTKL